MIRRPAQGERASPKVSSVHFREQAREVGVGVVGNDVLGAHPAVILEGPGPEKRRVTDRGQGENVAGNGDAGASGGFLRISVACDGGRAGARDTMGNDSGPVRASTTRISEKPADGSSVTVPQASTKLKYRKKGATTHYVDAWTTTLEGSAPSGED